MRPMMAAVLVGVLVATGCLGTIDDANEGLPDPAVPGRSFHPPVNVSDRWPGAEPVVAAAPDGTLYYEGIGAAETEAGTRNVNRVWVSTDDGATWTDVTPPATGNQSSNDGFVAVGPDGAVYAANVFGLTFQVFKSTDQGASWTPLNVPRVPALMHRHWIEPRADGVVHVTVEALDPGAAPVLVGGPTATEGAVDTGNKGMYYTRSGDGGQTWTTPVRIDEAINYAGQSDMAVSADGQGIYVVRYREDGRAPLSYTYEDGAFYLARSLDGGARWERFDLFPLQGAIGSALTSLSIDDHGTLYFVWSQTVDGRAQTHLAVSTDQGDTWTVDRLPLSDGTQAMPFADVLAPGRLGLVWYDAHARGATGEVDAGWHVHAAVVSGADTGSPAVEAVTKVSDTVHEGEVCVAGPSCGEREGDRRLLDYPWIDVGPDGRMHLAFASTTWDRPSAQPLYAGQVGP